MEEWLNLRKVFHFIIPAVYLLYLGPSSSSRIEMKKYNFPLKPVQRLCWTEATADHLMTHEVNRERIRGRKRGSKRGEKRNSMVIILGGTSGKYFEDLTSNMVLGGGLLAILNGSHFCWNRCGLFFQRLFDTSFN